MRASCLALSDTDILGLMCRNIWLTLEYSDIHHKYFEIFYKGSQGLSVIWSINLRFGYCDPYPHPLQAYVVFFKKGHIMFISIECRTQQLPLAKTIFIF